MTIENECFIIANDQLDDIITLFSCDKFKRYNMRIMRLTDGLNVAYCLLMIETRVPLR